MSKPTAVIVCPGRGTYNKEELGYLSRFHASRNDVLAAWDDHRFSKGHAGLLELDRASTFSNDLHTRGNNAAPLIFASAYFDFYHDSHGVDDCLSDSGLGHGLFPGGQGSGERSSKTGSKVRKARRKSPKTYWEARK